MGQLLKAKDGYLSEAECWQQWGYYGIALVDQDIAPVVLPEKLLTDSFRYIDNLDTSRLFSLIVDWLYFYSDLLRPEVFLKNRSEINDRELRILCGVLSLQDKRKFGPLVTKLSSTLNDKKLILGLQGRMNSFGEDPVMSRFGIICTNIDKTRSDKKIMPRDKLFKYCSFLKARAIIGPSARSDFFTLRSIYPEKTIAQVRSLSFASKTSSIYFERNLKYFSDDFRF
jgi:hypothetical protein